MTTPALRSDPDFVTLKRYILDETGLEYYVNREDDLAQRLQKRLTARGMTRAREYLNLLRRTDAEAKAEWDILIDAVTIGETYFFRYPEQFDALREQILPELLRRNAATRRLNIWCAGCSNGAEPHTLAILLQRDFGDLLRDWQISILGTDINERFLQQARGAWYQSWALRTLDEASRRLWFEYDASTHRYTLKPGYRKNVRFASHNMIQEEPPLPESGHWDMVFCRNVLIYFDAPTIRQQILRFAGSLQSGGYLFLGHAEPGQVPEMGRLFETVRLPGALLYRRRKEGEVEDSTAFYRQQDYSSFLPAPAEAPALPWAPMELPDLPQTVLPSASRPPDIPIQKATDSPEATRITIRRLLDNGQAQEAESQLSALLAPVATGKSTLRHDPVLHYYHALSLEQLERWDEVEKALRRTLYLDRSFLLAHYHQALLAERNGEMDRAARSLDTVLKLLQNVSFETGTRESLSRLADMTPEEMTEVAQLKRATLPQEKEGKTP